MTGELKQNLTDVNRQKREIEAILLHMTDGVIAFDENGKVMHINPAAKELLNIDKEDNFDDIFKKLNVEIKKKTNTIFRKLDSIRAKNKCRRKNSKCVLCTIQRRKQFVIRDNCSYTRHYRTCKT